jgi:hypothetical protein
MPKQAPTDSPTTRRQNESQPAQQSAPQAKPPPGLDDARHRAAQQNAQQAELLREGLFPALMATAVNLSQFDSAPAYKDFLDRLLHDYGDPKNPTARMMIEQIALAHIRIAQLHGSAAHSQDLDAVKVYSTAAARLWGELRRSALALDAMTSPSSSEKTKAKLRLVTRAS